MNIMDKNIENVGNFNFCPACGRRAHEPEYVSAAEDLEEWVCTSCNRPWIACPCKPISEILTQENKTNLWKNQ